MTVATNHGGFYSEHCSPTGYTSLSGDIAHHLYGRMGDGQAIVVTTKPRALLSSVSKQWQQIVRQVERDKSRTLDASRIQFLTEKLAKMQRYQFTAKSSDEAPYADVFFMSPGMLITPPDGCRTIYITCPLSTARLDLIKRAMPQGGLLVFYDAS